MAAIGLTIAMPQLILGPLVALLLYQRWADARVVFAAGLSLIALACFSGARLTLEWNTDQFVTAQVLQALGQPMAVVSMLFLATSVVQPQEGPYVSGVVNTLRAFGSLAGSAVVGQLLTVRGRIHADAMLDHAGLVIGSLPAAPDPSQLLDMVTGQALVLSVADAYRVLGILSIVMIPFVLRLTRIPSPTSSSTLG
jgi:DHA2 family multidrug resistance protein